MHKEQPIRAAILPREVFAAATAQVNEWRGQCVDAFTRAETAVTECLAAMAESAGGKRVVQLPHLVGQRLATLSEAIGPGGSFEQEASAAVPALGRWRGYVDRRTFICHGVIKITLDFQGDWTIVSRVTTFRSSHLTKETWPLTQEEAGEFCDRVVHASQSLCAQLGQVRAKLSVRPAASSIPAQVVFAA